LVREGYCSYYELKKGTYKDIYNMLLMLEWSDYVQEKIDEMAKNRE